MFLANCAGRVCLSRKLIQIQRGMRLGRSRNRNAPCVVSFLLADVCGQVVCLVPLFPFFLSDSNHNNDNNDNDSSIHFLAEPLL